MAIIFNWAASGQLSGAVSATFTTSKGANTINSGDALILIGAANDSTEGGIDPGSLSTPSGFTLINQVVTGESEDIRAAAYYKIAGASETGAYTVSWTTAGGWAWALLDYSGTASTSDAASVATDTTTSTSVNAPSISPTGSADTLICAWIGPDNNVTTFPSGFTSRSNLANNGATVGQVAIGVADVALVSSGATGVKTATWGATRNSYVGVSIAFAAASGGGGLPPILLPSRRIFVRR